MEILFLLYEAFLYVNSFMEIDAGSYNSYMHILLFFQWRLGSQQRTCKYSENKNEIE